MSLNITYHDDGGVTVECGGQTVNIPSPKSRTPLPPRREDKDEPPPIVPRAFIRPLGDMKINELLDASSLEKEIAQIVRQAPKSAGKRKVINVQIKPNEHVNLERIYASARGVPGLGYIDLQFWLPPLK